MQNNFSAMADSFFLQNQNKLKHNDLKIIIFRNDGTVLHCSSKIERTELASMGALLGGLWQSARQLSTFVVASETDIDFRLSFDNSANGVYVIPMKGFMIATLYSQTINPGKLKQEIKKLAIRFQDFLEEDRSRSIKKDSKIKKAGLLFNNISDDEVDNLFSFIGK